MTKKSGSEELAALRDELANALFRHARKSLEGYEGFIPFAACASETRVFGIDDDRFEEDLDDKERIAYLVGLIERLAKEGKALAAGVCYQTHGTSSTGRKVQGVTALTFSRDGSIEAFASHYQRDEENRPVFEPLVRAERYVGIAWDVPVVETWAPQYKGQPE